MYNIDILFEHFSVQLREKGVPRGPIIVRILKRLAQHIEAAS